METKCASLLSLTLNFMFAKKNRIVLVKLCHHEKHNKQHTTNHSNPTTRTRAKKDQPSSTTWQSTTRPCFGRPSWQKRSWLHPKWHLWNNKSSDNHKHTNKPENWMSIRVAFWNETPVKSDKPENWMSVRVASRNETPVKSRPGYTLVFDFRVFFIHPHPNDHFL